MRLTRFEVFGRHVLVEWTEKGWQAYYLGDEGKRRAASDIIIPNDVVESGLDQYLADLCHEWATERSPGVKRIE